MMIAPSTTTTLDSFQAVVTPLSPTTRRAGRTRPELPVDLGRPNIDRRSISMPCEPKGTPQTSLHGSGSLQEARLPPPDALLRTGRGTPCLFVPLAKEQKPGEVLKTVVPTCRATCRGCLRRAAA